MAIKAYVEKEQNYQINNLTLQLEALEKEKKKTKPKLIEKRNNKTRAGRNEIENRQINVG